MLVMVGPFDENEIVKSTTISYFVPIDTKCVLLTRVIKNYFFLTFLHVIISSSMTNNTDELENWIKKSFRH
jgi:hypothetical protein